MYDASLHIRLGWSGKQSLLLIFSICSRATPCADAENRGRHIYAYIYIYIYIYIYTALHSVMLLVGAAALVLLVQVCTIHLECSQCFGTLPSQSLQQLHRMHLAGLLLCMFSMWLQHLLKF